MLLKIIPVHVYSVYIFNSNITKGRAYDLYQGKLKIQSIDSLYKLKCTYYAPYLCRNTIQKKQKNRISSFEMLECRMMYFI